MSAPIRLRGDLSASDVRVHARCAKDPAQVRRLLAIATILDGGGAARQPRAGGVTLQIVGDWVLRFNAEGPEGLRTRKAPGPPTILDDRHRRALEDIIEAGPIPAVHGVMRWRIIDLVQWLWDEFEVSISKQALGQELRTTGYRKLSARPRQRAQRAEDIAAFKKLPCPSGANPQEPARPHADRAVVPRRGPDRTADANHPSLGPAGHQTGGPARSAPRLGLDVGLRPPTAPGPYARLKARGRPRHAALQLRGHGPAPDRNQQPGRSGCSCRPDAQSGRVAHVEKLTVPDNITLLPLPPKCPELNPVENLWQFMREN